MIADLKPYTEYKESGLPWLGQVPGHWAAARMKCLRSQSRTHRHEGDDRAFLAMVASHQALRSNSTD
jgi:type I restriction enzyme S subunit